MRQQGANPRLLIAVRALDTRHPIVTTMPYARYISSVHQCLKSFVSAIFRQLHGRGIYNDVNVSSFVDLGFP